MSLNVNRRDKKWIWSKDRICELILVHIASSLCISVYLDSGDGEVPPHPDTPGAAEANAQSIDKYGTSIC